MTKFDKNRRRPDRRSRDNDNRRYAATGLRIAMFVTSSKPGRTVFGWHGRTKSTETPVPRKVKPKLLPHRARRQQHPNLRQLRKPDTPALTNPIPAGKPETTRCVGSDPRTQRPSARNPVPSSPKINPARNAHVPPRGGKGRIQRRHACSPILEVYRERIAGSNAMLCGGCSAPEDLLPEAGLASGCSGSLRWRSAGPRRDCVIRGRTPGRRRPSWGLTQSVHGAAIRSLVVPLRLDGSRVASERCTRAGNERPTNDPRCPAPDVVHRHCTRSSYRILRLFRAASSASTPRSCACLIRITHRASHHDFQGSADGYPHAHDHRHDIGTAANLSPNGTQSALL